MKPISLYKAEHSSFVLPDHPFDRYLTFKQVAWALFDAVPDLERLTIYEFPFCVYIVNTPGFDMPKAAVDAVWSIKTPGVLIDYSAKIKEDWE
jgi:hypothetical protein